MVGKKGWKKREKRKNGKNITRKERIHERKHKVSIER